MVDIVTYTPEFQEAVLACWELFREGKAFPSDRLRPLVHASWMRSKAANAPMEGQATPRISTLELEGAMAAGRLLLESARSIMEKVLESISPSPSTFSLANADGVILHSIGTSVGLHNMPHLEPGCSASEEDVGTNGLGTCLVEKEPIQIVGYEHYNKEVHGWSCSAAPIINVKGEVLGVLNLSVKRERFHPHSLGMVRAAAHAIGEQIRLRISLEEQRAMMELLDEGVVLLDSSSVIHGINHQAVEMLGLPSSPAGMTLQEVVGENNPLCELVGTQAPVRDVELVVGLRPGVGTCTVSATPVAHEAGTVLTMRETKRMREYATRIIGARASYTFKDILGDSPAVKDALKVAGIAARSDSTTLILGESGTGKELFAQAIHNASSRRSGPFVSVNCGALPRDLIQSELFGYDKGAFTGASSSGNPGKFELAQGGTIFLDEVGEMTLEAQVSLLRLLQESEVTRVGGRRAKRLDVRVIAATNKDLARAVDEQSFRDDLYYRLNVLAITTPALRGRFGDITLLAEFFLDKTARSMNRGVINFSKEALGALTAYNWPGNVRELQNTIERMVNMCSGTEIGVSDLPEAIAASIHSSHSDGNRTPVQESEHSLILTTLSACKGNVRKTALKLGVSRGTLYNKLRKYKLTPSDFRRPESV